MNNEYRGFYEELRFSDDQKESMKMKLIEQARKQAASTDASPANGNVTQRHPAAKPFRFAAAAAIVGALLLGGGGVAYATGALGGALHFFDEVINGASAQTEVIERIGRPIGASATDDGVTITAEAIMGDRSSYAVIYSIEKEDGSPFDTQTVPGTPYLPYMLEEDPSAFGTFEILGGATGGNGESYFYDADPSDNAIQYIEKRSLMGDANVIGSTLTSGFLGLIHETENGEWESVAEGRWKLSFKVDYEDLSRELDAAGRSVQLPGTDAVVNELRISPISLAIGYTVDEPAILVEESSGQESSERAAESERVLDLGDIVIAMKDGSTVVLHSNMGGSISDNGSNCEQVLFFESLLDVDEVESVSIGGEVFDLAG